MREKVSNEMTKPITQTTNDELTKDIHLLHSDAEKPTKKKQDLREMTTSHRQRRPSLAVG